MGSGWYDMGYSFEEGQACAGKEENHPSTDLCEVTGTSIGNLVNKRVMIAAININKGEKLEMWSKFPEGAWQKDVETGPGVTGFRPSEDTDEIQIRIDAAPGIDMHSANFYEIQGTGTSTSGGEITNEAEGTEAEEEGGGAQESGDGEEEQEEQEDDEESGNLARVLTARKAKKRLRRRLFRKFTFEKEEGEFIPYNKKIQDLHLSKLGGI